MFRLRSLVLLFLALLVATPAFAQSAAPTVSLGDTKDFGKILVGKSAAHVRHGGIPLFAFDFDWTGQAVVWNANQAID